MTSFIKNIELISEIGNFTFNHYPSLLDFEKNNWKKLGITSYNVTRIFEDGKVIKTLHEGINSSCYLALDVEGDE